MGRFAKNPYYAEEKYPGRKKVDYSKEFAWVPKFRERVAEYERCLLVELLTENKGNINKSARIGGMHESSLREKMIRFGLKKEDFR